MSSTALGFRGNPNILVVVPSALFRPMGVVVCGPKLSGFTIQYPMNDPA